MSMRSTFELTVKSNVRLTRDDLMPLLAAPGCTNFCQIDIDGLGFYLCVDGRHPDDFSASLQGLNKQLKARFEVEEYIRAATGTLESDRFHYTLVNGDYVEKAHRLRKDRVYHFSLQEQWDCPSKGKIDGFVKLTASGQLEISFNGYGEKTSIAGEGVPILLELYKDSPRVVIWSDINQEDPTHVISLSQATELNRKTEN